MSNGDTITQVKELLGDPKGMTIRTAVILSLQLQAELYEKWEKDHDKLEEIYPWAKEKKENGKGNERTAVGAAITSAVLLVFHVLSEYFGVKAAP